VLKAIPCKIDSLPSHYRQEAVILHELCKSCPPGGGSTSWRPSRLPCDVRLISPIFRLYEPEANRCFAYFLLKILGFGFFLHPGLSRVVRTFPNRLLGATVNGPSPSRILLGGLGRGKLSGSPGLPRKVQKRYYERRRKTLT